MRKEEETVRKGSAPVCPRCGYVSNRPHAALCPRCRETIPGAAGCSSCGKCSREVPA